ncbi:oligosaccharide flippase family protein [Natronomonas sp. EA1]|uniref:oligosaccharide flippase family protein n=1 Tax=Natronomonas sp. EA1 TaxID=3421655 RepID=UPI003EB7D2D1
MSSGAGKTSIQLFVIHLVARVVGFLGLAAFTKLLPQDQLGVYFLFYLVVQVAALFSSFGMGQALVRRISEGKRADAILSAALALVALVGGGLALAFYLLRDPIGSYVGAEVPLLLTLASVSWLLADILMSALRGEDKILLAGGLQLFQDVVRVGAGVGFLLLGTGPEGLMYGVIAGFVATVAVAGVATERSLARPVREDFSRLFSISRYTMFFGPTNFVYFWLDTFMIGLILTRGDVSAYEVAWQTTRVLIIATSAINQTLFPKVSQWASSGRLDEVERVIPGAIIFTLFFPLPGLVGLTLLGEEILGLVYQPAYAVAAIPMAILAGYMVVEALQRVANGVLTGMDRADIPFRARLVGVTLAVVLNVTLIPRYGLVGAAVATLTAKFVDTVMQWYGIGDLLTVRLPKRALSWEVVSAGVMGAVVVGITRVLAVDSLLPLFFAVGVGAAVYGLTVLYDDDIRQVVRQYVPV